MAQIIDSLVVTLGFDSKDLRRGQQEARDQVEKTKETVRKGGADIEKSIKSSSEFVNKLTVRFLELFAVLAGARGLKDFTSDLTKADAALGLFAANVGQKPQDVQALVNAIERVSHTSEGAAESIRAISTELANVKIGQQSQGFMEAIARIGALSGQAVDYGHGLTPFLLSAADALKKLDDQGQRTVALDLAQKLHIPESEFNLLVQGSKKLREEMAKSKEINPVSPGAITAADKLLTTFTKVEQTLRGIANEILPEIEPQVQEIAAQFQQWLQDNKKEILDDIKAVLSWIQNSLPVIVRDIGAIAHGIDSIVSSTTGWGNALKIVAGIWATMKIGQFAMWMARIAKSATTFAAAMTAGRAAAVAAPAVAAAAGGAPTAASVAARAGSGLGVMALPGALAGFLGYLAAKEGAWEKANPEKLKEAQRHSTGSGLGWAIDGSRATGGPVHAGETYLVGEHRPELFVPHTGGMILPDIGKMFAGMGSGIPNAAKSAANAIMGLALRVSGAEVSMSNPLPVKLVQVGANDANGIDGPGGPSGKGPSDPADPSLGKGTNKTGNWWTPERMQHASERLQKEAGLSEEGAAALVARWAGVEARGGPTAVNPKSGAFGVAQWLGSRKHGIAGNTNFDDQLTHSIKELNGSESRAAAALRAAKTHAEGARGASMYERAEHYNPRTGVDDFTSKTPVQKVFDAIRNHKKTLGPQSNLGIGAAGALMTSSNYHHNPVNNVNSQTHIGAINVHTPATNGHGIASTIRESVANVFGPAHANYGLA